MVILKQKMLPDIKMLCSYDGGCETSGTDYETFITWRMCYNRTKAEYNSYR